MLPASNASPAPAPAAEIFKAYDIRGIVERTLTVEAVEQVGRAIGSCCKSKRESRKRLVWVVQMRFFARSPPLRGPWRTQATSPGIELDG